MRKFFFILSVIIVCAHTARGQTDTNTLRTLRRELDELRQRARQLEEKLLLLEKASSGAAVPATAAANNPTGTVPAVSSLSASTNASAAAVDKAISTNAWSPAQPITLMRAGSSYMNVSFDAILNAGWSTASDVSQELQLGDHDPLQRGFSMRNAELALDGAVDPYFKGFANIALKLDQDAGTEIELEEAYLMTTALPGNLQFKAGQFFSEFGRQNAMHPHQWAFVDQPLVLSRMFGPDGLRNPGARLSWLAPTPFYTEAMLGVFNSQGGTAFSFRDSDPEGSHGRAPFGRRLENPGEMLYVPRVTSSFDLTDHQTVMVGASGAFGPNDSGPKARTEIYGVDTYWKWKPGNASEGFPFVSWQNEFLFRRYGAGAYPTDGLPSENLRDWGFYSQLLWGFKPHWVAGLRGEFADGNAGSYDANDPFRGERARVSPNMTWFPSEFSKIRLQYNLDRSPKFDYEHSVWLQLEFLLGAHGAHKF